MPHSCLVLYPVLLPTACPQQRRNVHLRSLGLVRRGTHPTQGHLVPTPSPTIPLTALWTPGANISKTKFFRKEEKKKRI